ncbi:MAG: 1-deoxy-D-xylulose-5-phosphate reductoisomerase [Candidatus Omnitrophica bacterium]|nr:1-deoxy-D-xylulose-5-phosphate reductoisomerase [Candidatus Omnitrophota bacterium]
MKNIAILGSTGSIGKNSIKIIKELRKDFRILALSANSNIKVLSEQIKETACKSAWVADRATAASLKSITNGKVSVFSEDCGLDKILSDRRLDKVILAVSGSAALKPLLRAIDYGLDIALANKEALVMAGPLIMKRARLRGVKIIPVDSEQSAIWQCLRGEDMNRLKKIYLTASGGPLRGSSRQRIKKVTVAQVLKHPRWKMGKKITVDSATLMNKGLELLEAMYLFGVGHDKIRILIHPEAIVHSMVEFVDGIILAQLSATDMRIPIQYALTYPQRLPSSLPELDFYKIKNLNFAEPNFKLFPCLKLSLLAAKKGGTLPAVLNAANEISVQGFLSELIDFTSIAYIIEKVTNEHKIIKSPGLEQILDADRWARSRAWRFVQLRSQKR